MGGGGNSPRKKKKKLFVGYSNIIIFATTLEYYEPLLS
jgi:hypothetical protein